jgi:CRISPR-associated endonuclease/helicase Cas3
MSFPRFFRLLTASNDEPDGRAPYPYQERFATSSPSLVEIPTGLGKTDAIIVSWLWRRMLDPATTPRRLVYSLPMRSLVEQTAERAQHLVANFAVVASPSKIPALHVVMGGDVGDEGWFDQPEHPCIVVGTQDMLLSRALNRGYAMSRFQWPMAFGAINNDVLWVVDEVQLHGIGAVTAAQLQGLREKLGSVGPARTIFMSATIDRAWLNTVDHPLGERAILGLAADDLACEPARRILEAPKTIVALRAQDDGQIASAIIDVHRPGTLTLVVLNTVERARSIFRRLERQASAELVLLHSRFRPADRKSHFEQLRAPVHPDGIGRIAVATQVVEAGLDLDGATLVTDVAPWSSIVQRFGRCNRRGGFAEATCYWIDAGEPTPKTAPPYDVEELQQSRGVLLSLEGRSGSPAVLPRQPIALDGGLTLRRIDLIDLFDTSPDLSGHDVDVSRFIRQADDFTASVFWRAEPPSEEAPPHRDELCPASLSELRRLLKKLSENGRRGDARIANQFGSPKGKTRPVWATLDERSVRPGLQIWLHSDVGWYDPVTGFGERNAPVEPIQTPTARGFQDECTTVEGDRGSQIGTAVTLSRHAVDTAEEAEVLVGALDGMVGARLAGCLVNAALWHDVGKAHAVFRETMERGNGSKPPDGEFWAKSRSGARHQRPGFRHEVASALAFLNANKSVTNVDLAAFLIAAHHGKLRVFAQPLPFDSETSGFLGNCDGDRIPEVHLGPATIVPRFEIDLAMFRLGAADGVPTWLDRVSQLRDDEDLGPFRLAYLELCIRIADWRASRKEAALST